MRGSLYIPGNSWLHNVRAGRKLLMLILLGAGLVVVHNLLVLACVLLVVAGLIYPTGISFKKLWPQLKAFSWFVLLLALYSAFVQSPLAALETFLRLSSLILAALLVSMTTTITQMMAVVEWLLKPLDKMGWVDVTQISLAFGLTMRLIPELSVQWSDIREAQTARGIKPGIITMLLPMLVRTLRRAQELSEAIDARAVH